VLRDHLIRLGVADALDKFAEKYFQVEFLNEGRLPGSKDGPVLLVMNHTAFFGLEAYLLGSRLFSRDPDFDYRTLVWKGFSEGAAGPWFRAMGCETISIERGSTLLKQGKNVLVLPEGVGATDVRNRFNAFRTGYLRILKEEPVPIIPIGFSGVDEAIPWWVLRNRFLADTFMKPVDSSFDFFLVPKVPIPRPTKVVLSVGEPIHLSAEDLSSEEGIQTQNEAIKSVVTSLADEAEAHRQATIEGSTLNRWWHKLAAGRIQQLPF
jgi:1-acyl-sn-glycerol-3-phosphate acyltransferase